jgi:hypothetical protein
MATLEKEEQRLAGHIGNFRVEPGSVNDAAGAASD